MASVLAAAPSFKSESNLRAQIDTADKARQYNKPTNEQLEEVAVICEEQAAVLLARAADIRGCIQDAKDVEEIVRRAHVSITESNLTSTQEQEVKGESSELTNRMAS